MRIRNWLCLKQHVRVVYIFIWMTYSFSGYSMVYAQGKSLDQGLNEIAQQITETIPSGTKQTVAVMDNVEQEEYYEVSRSNSKESNGA